MEHGLSPGDFPGSAVSAEGIDAAVSAFRQLAGWHVFPILEHTVTVTVPGDSLVTLPSRQLHEIISLSVDGSPVNVGDCVVYPEGMVLIPHLRPRRDGLPRVVSATIRDGYDPPPAVVGVIGAMAARASRPSESYNVGRISVGAPGTLTPQSTEWRIVDQYKLGPVP